MKTLKTFLSEAAMDDKVKLLVKLDKQKEKLDNAVSRNMGINTKGAYLLRDKYEELKDKAEELGVWDLFCKKKGLDKNHDARDFWV